METLYKTVSSGVVPEDQQTLNKINEFLEKYPTTVPADKRPGTVWTELSVQELFKRSVKTAIDIINDVADVVSNKDTMSNAAFRRELFAAFTSPDRRLYLGLWLIFISFILYFVDSTA